MYMIKYQIVELKNFSTFRWKGEDMADLTIKDIAKICGVGISTVSRAINDDPGINQNTRKRILKVIKEYN